MNIKSILRPIRTQAVLAGSLATLAALSLSATTAAGAAKAEAEPTRAKPTVVLVHGAFADASSWNDVIKRLQHAGYPVIAPANPLRGLTGDAAYLNSVLDSVKGPIVLVGHSYGGSVISQAAAGDPDVKALVYIAAFAPDKGESALELSDKYPGSTLGPTLNSVPITLADGTAGTDLYIKSGEFRDQFAADVPTARTDLMAATQRPVTSAALEEKATASAWKTIPSWYLVSTQDKNIPPAAQRFMARRAHARTVEVKASHAVSVSRPADVTRLIEEAASSVR
ncbi:alpha/beta fold hydrolase [Streptomyces sp. NPDC048521]|uniref:alpha/beta fold hydrolase n=1 Tax=Streptomyces sp. NPDC048521 TaxID=3365566 RepID=UPI00371653CB